MDHDVYEEQMIDMVNRHAEEKAEAFTETAPTKPKLFTKADARTLGRGIKRMTLALITAAMFALAVNSFLMVGFKSGWWAVVAFMCGIVLSLIAVFLLYAQGIARVGKTGEVK